VDLSNVDLNVTILCALAIAVGLLGIVVPALPGLMLCWASVLVWAIFAADGWQRWLVLGIATLITVAGTVIKYAWPGRDLKRSGVPGRSLLAGGVLGLIGFFVIPVVGLIVGFILGIYLAELSRLGDSKLAWPSTKHAIRAAGLAMLIELTAGLGVATTWVIGVLVD